MLALLLNFTLGMRRQRQTLVVMAPAAHIPLRIICQSGNRNLTISKKIARFLLGAGFLLPFARHQGTGAQFLDFYPLEFSYASQ